jgi:ribonuclease HII
VRRAERERLALAIREQSVGVGVGAVEPEEIDRLNIYRASLEAMRRAVVALREHCDPGHLLVDARTVPGVDVPQSAIVHGDAEDASIAAASIVAKVHRDELMRQLDERYPGYGFAQHMGYGTPQHLDALQRLGPSPIHRRSFAPVARALRS